MSNFRIVKNGYDKEEVDNYIFHLLEDNEKNLQAQKIRISDQKRELEKTKEELNSFKEKNENISDALVVAVETAKQIENSSKNIYELEIKRIRSLYDKWQKFLDDLMKKYPDLQTQYDTKLILKVFADDINSILSQNQKSIEQKQTIETEENLESNTIGLKMLINKMSNVSRNGTQIAKIEDSKPKIHTIVRNPKPSVEAYAEHQAMQAMDDEFNRLKKDMIKPIAKNINRNANFENLVDQFLRDDDKSYENNAYSKVFLAKEKNDEFNLKEAVSPTENLEEIMKSFSFYPENDTDKQS